MYYKACGETTKEFADRLRRDHFLAPHVKVAICGKLDPQAEGKTVVLFGDDTVKMPEYLESNKTYEFCIALGVSTDSDDIMGLKTSVAEGDMHDNISVIKDFMTTFIKNQKTQRYHPISAKKIRKEPGKKKPLWYWHKKGVLVDADLPSKDVEVFSLMDNYPPVTLDFNNYMKMVMRRLNLITNKEAFNIVNIIHSWKSIKLDKIILIPYQIKVSKGFYVRMISKEIRDQLNIPVHIFGIKRLKVEKILQ
uniref:tRNA pseudouridine(55) synthase n=1 Tax=viral metagenome TaxID=1070528 RepID=A0A6C0B5D1_9ZZZZ